MIHSFYRLIFKIWRPARHRRFLRIIQPSLSDTLLDVGGFPDNWSEYPPCVARIDALNTHPMHWHDANRPEIKTLVGDGCALQFQETAYAIAYSNSVIEHVGDSAHQAAFAHEMRRVGRKVWVQTPAWEFPIEPHYLAPFVHWLPKSWRPFIVRWFTPRGWIDRKPWSELRGEVDSTELLSKRDMHRLFPDCRIITERVFGIIPKSHIAVRD